jgi:hypothetical protein
MTIGGSLVTPAHKRRRPLKSYPMDPDLIEGLVALAEQEHLPVSAVVRRAIRRELEREGVLSPSRVAPKPVTKGGKTSK